MYMFTQINLILHSLFIWKWSTKYPIDCKRWTSLIPPWYGSRDKSCIHTKEATWSELVSKIPDFCEQIFKLLTSWRWGIKWLSLIPHQFIFFKKGYNTCKMRSYLKFNWIMFPICIQHLPGIYTWTHVSSEVAPRVSFEAMVAVGRLSLGWVILSLGID